MFRVLRAGRGRIANRLIRDRDARAARRLASSSGSGSSSY